MKVQARQFEKKAENKAVVNIWSTDAAKEKYFLCKNLCDGCLSQHVFPRELQT